MAKSWPMARRPSAAWMEVGIGITRHWAGRVIAANNRMNPARSICLHPIRCRYVTDDFRANIWIEAADRDGKVPKLRRDGAVPRGFGGRSCDCGGAPREPD